MGYGLPAAIGAQLAFPKATVIDVAGDGSIQMNIQELATAKQAGTPVKIAILTPSVIFDRLDDFLPSYSISTITFSIKASFSDLIIDVIFSSGWSWSKLTAATPLACNDAAGTS